MKGVRNQNKTLKLSRAIRTYEKLSYKHKTLIQLCLGGYNALMCLEGEPKITITVIGIKP